MDDKELFAKNHSFFDMIFECVYDGVVVVSQNGNIQYMSENYCRFLNVDSGDVTGKHVTNVIENTRMHLVARTGKEEIADLQFLRGNYVIANRIPLMKNREIVGAVGTIIFRDIREWQKMNSHIKGLLSELNFYRDEWQETNGVKYSLHDLIGESEPIKALKERVERISGGDMSVLIRGESGTGKELFAHSIHQLSERSHKPFVKVNCGAIPEHLIESELFGYEEGAFTGAKKGGKLGKFQFADGGTIFLDEIGDMPLLMQIKLLRVLQEKEFEPIGALQSKKVDVRIIAATNRPLENMIGNKLFREDLFYRINAVQLQIPSLRERRVDIPLLAHFFLKKITARAGKRISGFEQQALTLIKQYDWPGNIRELENVIEASVHLSKEEMIGIEALPDYVKDQKSLSEALSLKKVVADAERKLIEQVLKQVDFDKKQAATILGIGKTNLYEKIKRYHLKLPN